MRVRIVRKPPAYYTSGVAADLLAVGRVYNLESSLASALMVDGYAEAYDTLTAAEKRERAGESAHHAWTAADHAQRWSVPPRKKRR
jgi:hypothetical protein